MDVLSISSLKGGVGKTTVTLGLASSAFAAGLKTLVVDLDPQCDATIGLGVRLDSSRPSALETLQNPKLHTIQAAITSSSWAKGTGTVLDVLPSSTTLVAFDSPMPDAKTVWRLEEVLATIESHYDLVLVDTPPSLNALTRTAWVASDRVAIVTEPSLFSVTAASRGLKAIDEVKHNYSERLSPFGIIVNRYRPYATEHRYRLQELNEMFGKLVIEPIFEELPSLQQAQGAARPLHSWPLDAVQRAAHDFDEVLGQFLENVRSSRA